MPKKNEKLGTKKIDTMQVGVPYKVNYSSFAKKSGSRGDFMSASFICEDSDGNQFWVNTPNEKSAYKAIGVISQTRINGHKATITSLEVIKNGKYFDFAYTLAEYIPEDEEVPDVTAGDFEEISAPAPSDIPF